jgi:hypothetical protein
MKAVARPQTKSAIIAWLNLMRIVPHFVVTMTLIDWFSQ